MTSTCHCQSRIPLRRGEDTRTLCKCYKNAMQLKFGDIRERYKRYIQVRHVKICYQTLVVTPFIQTLKIRSLTCLTEAWIQVFEKKLLADQRLPCASGGSVKGVALSTTKENHWWKYGCGEKTARQTWHNLTLKTSILTLTLLLWCVAETASYKAVSLVTMLWDLIATVCSAGGKLWSSELSNHAMGEDLV